jgi:phthalate 4,5-cis-dihydrodiol dehydrogenase
MTTIRHEETPDTVRATGKLKAGVIGLGAGAMQVVKSLIVAPNYELVAGADVRKQARDAFETTFHGRSYSSAEELCKDPEVDVVWISTPNQLHAEHAITAANHGKHIVVEKPMAVTLQQAEQMIEAADKNKVNLLCGHTASLMAGFRAMRRTISSGELGTLQAMNLFSYNDWLFRPRMAAELDMAQGGGMPFRQGPHQFDVVRLMGGGMVRSVRGQVRDWMPFRGSPGYYVAYLEFEDGTPATVIKNGYGGFSAGEFLPFLREGQRNSQALALRRSLRKGEYVDEEAGKEAMRFGGGREKELSERSEGGGGSGFQMDAGIIIACCEKGDIRQSPEGLWIYDDEGQREVVVEGLRDERMAELDEMYQAITQKRPVHHDGRWGMATLEVILAMIQSSEERREIQLTHQCPPWE